MTLQRSGMAGGRRKKMRLYVALGALALIALAATLVLRALGDGLSFFYTPSKVVEKSIQAGQQFKLGGLVAVGSVERDNDGLTVRFVVTDFDQTIPVSYTGILPDLFREGQGVVAEGRLDENGTFVAHSVLAKHDENYMPKEVADALKESGHWQYGAPMEKADEGGE